MLYYIEHERLTGTDGFVHVDGRLANSTKWALLAEHEAKLNRRGSLGDIVGVIRWEQCGPYSKPVPWMAGQL